MLVLALAVCLFGQVLGHGRLVEPPARSTMWRFGFNTPRNWNDNELFCGGFSFQQSQGGKCGICGDPYPGPRDHEAGGKYASGTIAKRYEAGQVIEVGVDITANHKGWFEFRICPNNDVNRPATQECLDRYLLPQADSSGTRYYLPSTELRIFNVRLQLPPSLTCSQCVLQWKYNTGNSWGRDADTGRECVGCGPQEQFYGCADVSIGSDGPIATNPPRTDPPRTNPPATNAPRTDPPRTDPPATDPPFSPPAPTPSPWPTEWPDKDCNAIGDWASNPSGDDWCRSNCLHFPPYCPEHMCRCFTPQQ